jgi:hypothetical protein
MGRDIILAAETVHEYRPMGSSQFNCPTLSSLNRPGIQHRPVLSSWTFKSDSVSDLFLLLPGGPIHQNRHFSPSARIVENACAVSALLLFLSPSRQPLGRTRNITTRFRDMPKRLLVFFRSRAIILTFGDRGGLSEPENDDSCPAD